MKCVCNLLSVTVYVKFSYLFLRSELCLHANLSGGTVLEKCKIVTAKAV